MLFLMLLKKRSNLWTNIPRTVLTMHHTLNNHIPQPLTVIKQVGSRPDLRQSPSMALNRGEILMELISMGELPPKSWTNAEMQVRMEELRKAHSWVDSDPKDQGEDPPAPADDQA